VNSGDIFLSDMTCIRLVVDNFFSVFRTLNYSIVSQSFSQVVVVVVAAAAAAVVVTSLCLCGEVDAPKK